MIYVTSCGKSYGRPWVFPTFRKVLGRDRAIALLDPDDERELPAEVLKVPFEGGRFYQDGRFLQAIDKSSIGHVSDDRVVVLCDADAVFQRAPYDGELDPPTGGVAVGWNDAPGQMGFIEYARLAPKMPVTQAATKCGTPWERWNNCVVYNWGLVSATAGTWRRLARSFRSLFGEGEPGWQFFTNATWMQYLISVALDLHRYPVRALDYETHSHFHFGPRPQHEIRDRVLSYRGETVLYAHYCLGVTHD